MADRYAASQQYHRHKPGTQRPVADDENEEEADEMYSPFVTPRSAIRYTTTADQEVIQRGNQRIIIHHTPPPRSQQPPQQQSQAIRKQKHHWLFWCGCIFCLMLLGWTVLSVLSGFIQAKRDDLLYGNPRTFQTDINVGHAGRVSHIIAVNLGGYIEIIETQRGHPEAAHIYTPANLVVPATDPVTLTFADLTGDGRLDMIIQTPTVTAILYNTGTSFQSQPPSK